MKIFTKLEKNLGKVVFISIFLTIIICSQQIIFAESGYVHSKIMSNVEYMEGAKNKEIICKSIKDINKNMNKFMKQKASLYKIIFTDDKYVDEVKGYYHCKKETNGLIDFKNKTIIVRGITRDAEWTEQIFYHQLGHAIDSYDDYDACSIINGHKYSSNNNFLFIFNQEGNSIRDKAYFKEYINNRTDAFAESFAIYMMYPSYMKNKAPKLYSYIDSIVNVPTIKGWIYNSGTDKAVYVDNYGKLVKGWFKDPMTGAEYHFDKNGFMQKGIAIDNIKLSEDGKAIK